MLKEIDLSYLNTLIDVTSADDLDAKLLKDLSADNFTLAMYRAGFLETITDTNGIIIGFNFHPPQNFNMSINGTSGADSLTTGNGDDFVYADEGDDTVDAGAGNDLVSGGAGNDSLYGGDNSDELYGDAGSDVLSGGNGDDVLNGGQDSDELYGDDGDDRLYGDEGSDALFGGNGNDVISGGAGIDNLWGNAGADTFAFTADSAFTGIDGIRDFKVAEGDKIDISDLLTAYDPLSSIIEDFVQITDNGTNSFIAVDVDGNGNNYVTVASVLNVTGVTSDDLVVSGSTVV